MLLHYFETIAFNRFSSKLEEYDDFLLQSIVINSKVNKLSVLFEPEGSGQHADRVSGVSDWRETEILKTTCNST